MRLSMRALVVLVTLGAGAARAEDEVRLANQKFVHFGPVSYLKVLGPKHGLRVEERVFDKGIDIISVLQAEQVDVAAMAADVAIAARAGGAPIVLVSSFARGGTRLVGRASLGIKTVKDLKGKKVGVARGSVAELLLLAELAQNGLTWSERGDVQLVYTPFADLNAALKDGKVDAMCQSEPYAAQSMHEGFGKEIVKPYDTPLGEPARVLVMTEKFYREKPEVAQRVVTTLVEGTRMFHTAPAAAEKFVRETVFAGKLTAQAYKDAVGNATFTNDISKESIEVTTQLMMKYGVGRMLRPPAVAEWVKLDLLEKAKREASN